jgi:hypothetical protein
MAKKKENKIKREAEDWIGKEQLDTFRKNAIDLYKQQGFAFIDFVATYGTLVQSLGVRDTTDLVAEYIHGE